jgi:hypothetical protein
MPPTRAQGEAALKYVVLTVMNQPEDGPIKKSLPEAMIENVEDLGSLIESDIENLTFIAADTNPTDNKRKGTTIRDLVTEKI